MVVGEDKLFVVEMMGLSWEDGSIEGDVLDKLVETKGELEVELDKRKLLFIGGLAEVVTTLDDEWDGK